MYKRQVEQLLTMGVTFYLFWRFAPQSLEAACFAAMLSSTLGEMSSFVCGWAAYRRSLKRNCLLYTSGCTALL